MNTEEDVMPICNSCKENPPDPSYMFPLCQKCRSILIKRPFPGWIKVVMVIIGGLMIYSCFKLPTVLKAVAAQTSARHAEEVSDYSSAISEYQNVLKLFPKSQEHKARLAICYIKTGELSQAGYIIDGLDEKSLSKDVISELNTLIRNVKPKYN